MSKTLQIITGFVVLILVAFSIYLFVQVQALNRHVRVVGAEADSLYAWVYRADALWSPRWELVRKNFNDLRALHHLDALPPWGAVPPIPPRCVPPEPCPPL